MPSLRQNFRENIRLAFLPTDIETWETTAGNESRKASAIQACESLLLGTAILTPNDSGVELVGPLQGKLTLVRSFPADDRTFADPESVNRSASFLGVNLDIPYPGYPRAKLERRLGVTAARLTESRAIRLPDRNEFPYFGGVIIRDQYRLRTMALLRSIAVFGLERGVIYDSLPWDTWPKIEEGMAPDTPPAFVHNINLLVEGGLALEHYRSTTSGPGL